MATKNVFANMAADSDDEFEAKPMTKTKQKKEDRKITEKEPVAAKPVKVNESEMMKGGFENVVGGQTKRGGRPQTGRGGRDGDRGGRGRGRGDRGGRGGQTRLNEHGEPVFDPAKRQGGRFEGKPRDSHPFDRHSGAGRGTRKPDEKKGGFGRGNWGGKPDRAHKQGGRFEDGVPNPAAPDKLGDVKEEAAAEPKKEKKVEEEKQPEPETEEVIIGYSLDDYMKTRTMGKKAEAREAEGIKGVSVQAGAGTKGEKVGQILKKDLTMTNKQGGHQLLGFASVEDDEDEGQRGGGARRGRGGRGGRPDRQNQPAPAKRGDAKKALKRMSDEDFPAL